MRLKLPRSVLAASGSLGWGDTLEGLVEAHRLGGFITPTLTLPPREGNPMPRTAEASAGFLHANGLPNPGLERFLDEHLPRLRALGCPLIVSLLGTTASEWAELAKELGRARGITALELNLTPFLFSTPCKRQRLFLRKPRCTGRYRRPFKACAKSLPCH
ncbi:hypothetical protein [Chthonomonas calidirosea]|uniref:hypothetical protein n=1 Tax=Chthonomonas calidirosea TaxID=454171 RepID=UPI0003A66AD4|nr:hypothetical protein [Chthonomonas calidirosea]